MGGEPLLRPQLVHKMVSYAAKKGFWIYLPTNGRLLRHDVIDRLGDAGVATFNFAVDAVDEKPGLPKALTPIRPYFEHLVKSSKYGYAVFFNMNICRNNLDDVRQLTEIAHDTASPPTTTSTKLPCWRPTISSTSTTTSPTSAKKIWPKVDELVDWLIDKNKSGYQDGELGAAPHRYARLHAGQAAGVELPRRP